jgi:hypothetical protein
LAASNFHHQTPESVDEVLRSIKTVENAFEPLSGTPCPIRPAMRCAAGHMLAKPYPDQAFAAPNSGRAAGFREPGDNLLFAGKG